MRRSLSTTQSELTGDNHSSEHTCQNGKNDYPREFSIITSKTYRQVYS